MACDAVKRLLQCKAVLGWNLPQGQIDLTPATGPRTTKARVPVGESAAKSVVAPADGNVQRRRGLSASLAGHTGPKLALAILLAG